MTETPCGWVNTAALDALRVKLGREPTADDIEHERAAERERSPMLAVETTGHPGHERDTEPMPPPPGTWDDEDTWDAPGTPYEADPEEPAVAQ